MTINYIDENTILRKEINAFLAEWNNSLDYVIAKTSGSTGEPKEIKISKEKMKLSARMTGDFLSIQPNENALLCLSINTIAGKMMVVRALELNLNLFVSSPSSNPLDLINLPIDFIAIVPLQMSGILKSKPSKLKSIRNCIVGGGIISEEQKKQLIRNQLTVFQTYGMTETLSHVAMRKVGLETEDFYTALKGNTFQINENAQLIVESPLLDEKTIVTNDIVELLSSTEFKWKGRIDFVINSGGIKLYPEEIESKLSSIFTVPFFISSVKDEILGEKVILNILEKQPFSLSKTDFEKVLSKYEIPKEIHFYNQFEFTESQKINKIKTIYNTIELNAIQQVL